LIKYINDFLFFWSRELVANNEERSFFYILEENQKNYYIRKAAWIPYDPTPKR
jgi:hypothetical protein